MTTFNDFPDQVFSATITGSNGIVVTGSLSPNKIIPKLDPAYMTVGGTNVGINVDASVVGNLSVTGNLYINGDIGISTVNPQDKLHVNGAMVVGPDAGTNGSVQMFSNGTDAAIEAVAANNHSTKKNLLLVPYGGNVGVGLSTAPNAKLEIDSSDSSGRILLTGHDTPMITNGYDKFSSGAYNGAGRWGMFMEPNLLVIGKPTSGGGISFKNYNADSTSTEMIHIDSAGNLGVGTTPTNKLEVNGNIKLSNTLLLNTNRVKIQDTSGSYVGAYISSEPAGGILNSSAVSLRPNGFNSNINEYNTNYGGFLSGHMWYGSSGTLIMWLADGLLLTPPINTLDSGSIITQNSWNNVTFNSGWGNYDSNHQSVQYFKDSLGFIRLRGIAARSSGVSQTIFTLPSGYRPLKTESFLVVCGTSYGQIDISSAGVVTINPLGAGGFTFVQLSSISFDTR